MTRPHGGRERRVWAIGLVVATVIVCAAAIGVSPAVFFGATPWSALSELAGGLASPDFSASFLTRIGTLAVESLAIGLAAVLLALVAGFLLSLLAARAVAGEGDRKGAAQWARRGLRWWVRALLVVFRAVPDLVWAFLFVRLIGLGPGAAVLAIAVSYTGAIGKLYAELLESADPRPARALLANGVPRLAAVWFGTLPQVARGFISYGLFRVECAVRSASILGVVGAGGLGSEIDLSIRYFQYDKLATTLLAVLAYVVVLELLSRVLRARPLWIAAAAVAVAGVVSLGAVGVPWQQLTSASALHQARAFLSGLSHPVTTSEALATAFRLGLETVAMALVATALAFVAVVVLAPLGARSLMVSGYNDESPRRPSAKLASRLVHYGVRFCLQLFRAVPDLVWALLFVVWIGPGVTAGVAALAVHTMGVLGRLYADTLDDVDPRWAQALEAHSGSRLAVWLFGVWPTAWPTFIAFAIYRFEVNVRDAVMVGFVGAGGIGDAIHTAISLFFWNDLATLLLVMITLVMVIDVLGDRARRRFWAS